MSDTVVKPSSSHRDPPDNGQENTGSLETPRALGSGEWPPNDVDQLCEGYDYEFIPQPDKKYECAICLQVLREAQQTECGHRFCRCCIYRWLSHMNEVNQIPKCPVCAEKINPRGVFPDTFVNREILQFKVRCPNSRFGCAVTVELKSVQNHRSICMHEEVPCPQGCAKYVRRMEITIHLKNECTQRIATCHWCQSDVYYFEKQLHEAKCGDVVVPCKDCQRPLMRKQMLDHYRVGCDNDVQPCIFAILGCTSKHLHLNEIAAHNASHIQEHLQCVAMALSQLLNQLPTQCSKSETLGARATSSPDLCSSQALARENSHDFDRQTDHFRRQMSSGVPSRSWAYDSLSKMGDGKGTNNGAQYVNVPPIPARGTRPLRHSMPDEDATIQKVICDKKLNLPAVCDREMVTPMSSLDPSLLPNWKEWECHQDSRIATQEQQILELHAKVNKLESQLQAQSSLGQFPDISQLENRLCNGVFIWRIPDFTRQRNDAARSPGTAAVLHSAGFYTSFYGYKLCLRVNLNGVEGGSGTHVSVFIHFMQGEFDDLLTWPFRGRITLSILDQGPQKVHIIETLEAKPSLAAFQRPHSKRNHKGFGYIEFAPLRLLKNSTFLLNDTLIVKAEVTEKPSGVDCP